LTGTREIRQKVTKKVYIERIVDPRELATRQRSVVRVAAEWVQETFREHSGNLQGTFREHSGNIQGTFGKHSWDIRTMYFFVDDE
jgi:hypothetical protein